MQVTGSRLYKRQESKHQYSATEESSEKVRLVFLGGLPLSVSRRELLEYLSRFGTVERLVLPINPETGLSKGHGKAIFSDNKGRDRALERVSHSIRGVMFGITPWIDPSEYFMIKIQENRRKLFVKHRSKHLEADLLSYFQQYGEVSRLDMRKNHTNNKPRNFCYVYFCHKDSIRQVLEVKSHRLRDQPLVCKPCVPSDKEVEQQRTALEHLNLQNSLSVSVLDKNLEFQSQNKCRNGRRNLPNTSSTNQISQTQKPTYRQVDSHLISVVEETKNPFEPVGCKKSSRECPFYSLRNCDCRQEQIKPTSKQYPRQKTESIEFSHLRENSLQFKLRKSYSLN